MKEIFYAYVFKQTKQCANKTKKAMGISMQNLITVTIYLYSTPIDLYENS